MNGQPTIQYLGFRPSSQGREYAFSVRETSCEPCEYFVTIAHEDFQGRVRFQDAPGICSQRLQRELAAAANHPLETRYLITEAELAEYRAAHAPRTPGRRS
ncbi:MAG: hypothetical protein LAN84_01995 [Acidobacteriia bacterium]|nr:hypothetical protein [Terriglobia bacterium]